MHIAIAGCSGVIGPHLIHWLLANSDATVIGCDSTYDRLGELLSSERFTYYFAHQPADDQLLLQLIVGADVFVDLRQIEGADAATRLDDVANRGAQRILAAACEETKTRLVQVVPAEPANGGTPGSGEDLRSPARDKMVAEAAGTHRQGAGAVMTEHVASGTREAALLHDATTPAVTIRDGHPLGPMFVVVRLSHVLGDQLEVVPRLPLSSLERLRDAILMSADDRINFRATDLERRTFLYVLDAASALGRIAIGRVAAFPADPIEIGNPDFHLATADVARLVLEVFEARYWDRRSATPKLDTASMGASIQARAVSLIDISQADTLIEWRPRWTLNDAIDDALPRLLAGQ